MSSGITNIAKITEDMTNSKELFRRLLNKISLQESRMEIEAMVYILIETKAKLSRREVMAGTQVPLTEKDFEPLIERLNKHEPLQYILGETEFFGRVFKVSPSVLIPRPETELLVMEVLQFIEQKSITNRKHLKVVDIGTGSGCVAITLALEIQSMAVAGTDINQEAIDTAIANAKSNRCLVEFLRHDILREKLPFAQVDIIVSNPPYVTKSEGQQMNRTVKDFEPHLALFVPDNDPLVFYKAIASNGKQVLGASGAVFVEINENLGEEVAQVFRDAGFAGVSIKLDLDNKPRIVSAVISQNQ